MTASLRQDAPPNARHGTDAGPASDPARLRESRRAGVIGLAYGVAALLLCTWGYGAGRLPFFKDNQFYFYISERAASGVPPHISTFDFKHQLPQLVDAGFIAIGRLFGLDDVVAVRAASGLAFAISVVAVWLVGRGVAGNSLAGHIAALLMLGFGSLSFHAAIGAQPKLLVILFTALTALAMQKRRPFLTGLAAAAAHFCWQPALLTLGCAAFATALAPRRWRNLAWLAAGACMVAGAYEAYFAVHGAMREQFFQSYAYPAIHLSGRLAEGLTWADSVRRPWDTWLGGHRMRVAPVLFAATLVLAPLAAALRWRRVWPFVREQPVALFILMLGYAWTAFSLRDLQGTVDLFPLLPLVAWSCGLLAGLAVGAAPPDRWAWPRRLASAVCLGGCLWSAVDGWRWYRDFAERGIGYTLADQRKLATEVRSMLESGSGVYATGCVHLLALNHQDNFTPYGWLLPALEPYLTENGERLWLPMRDGRLPDVILLSRRPFESFDRWLPRVYEPVVRPEFAAQGVSVWRLRTVEARP